MPSTDRLSNIARARVSAVVLDEASGRERAATEVFNKVDGAGDGGPPNPDDSPGNGMPGGMRAEQHNRMRGRTRIIWGE